MRKSDVLIAVSSGLIWLAMLWLQGKLLGPFTYSMGISLLFIPAGVRMLMLLTGRFAAAAGIFASTAIAVHWVFPPIEISLAEELVSGVLAGFVPYAALRAAKAWSGVGSDLKLLRPKHFLLFAIVLSVVSPIAHNIWFTLKGIQAPGEFLPNAFSMAVGDFLGICFVLGLLVSLRMGFVFMSRRAG